MKLIFTNTELSSIYKSGENEGKSNFSPETIKSFIKKVNLLLDVKNPAQLQSFEGVSYEKLAGTLEGFQSIRINEQFRLKIKIEPIITKQQAAIKCFIHEIIAS